jgi:hypothetical protein
MTYISALFINLMPILLFVLVLAALVSSVFVKKPGQRQTYYLWLAAVTVFVLLLATVITLRVSFRVFALNIGPIFIFVLGFGGLMYWREKRQSKK